MKIFLAIDNTKFSQIAVQAVAKQFRTKGTQVRVLNVVEPISTYIFVDMIPRFVPFVAKVEQERRKEAKELVQRGGATHGVHFACKDSRYWIRSFTRIVTIRCVLASANVDPHIGISADPCAGTFTPFFSTVVK